MTWLRAALDLAAGLPPYQGAQIVASLAPRLSGALLEQALAQTAPGGPSEIDRALGKLPERDLERVANHLAGSVYA